MTQDHATIQWLMEGDPAIRWQTLQDLLSAPKDEVDQERQQVAESGWGARFLSFQEPSGHWGGGIYSPKWISTTYTMLSLRRLGLPPHHSQAQKACTLLLEKGFYRDGGINYFQSLNCSETCVTGMILSILAYFLYSDERIDRLVEYLFDQQMPDGGWNCEAYRGATHGSFHTTISVLEGLREYEKTGSQYAEEAKFARLRAHEFLLKHRLYKSHRTGEVVKPEMTRFSFPPRWHYDILRALDHFQESEAIPDERMSDAIEIVRQRRKKDGRWVLQNRYPGKTFFEMENVGKPSRWNTLRALRVLKWWQQSNKI